MKSTRFDSLYYWGAWQADRRIDFNGFFWTRAAGNVLIDPMGLDAADLEFVAEHGGVKAILLTGWDHVRASAALKETLGCSVCAPAEEKARFGDSAGIVDRWFKSASDLEHELDRDVQVYGLRGGKSPIESAFYLKPLQALVFGDLVRSHASGKLMLLPEAKLSDRAQAVADLAPLREVALRAVLLGDGDPIFNGAEEAFREFCAQLD